MSTLATPAHERYFAATKATHRRLARASLDARQNYEVQIAVAGSQLRRAAGFSLGDAFLPMYELRSDHPFVDKRNRRLKPWHDPAVVGACDLSNLGEARAYFKSADAIDAKLPAPKLGEGITYLLDALVQHTKGEEHGRALQHAANAFDAARLRDERCSPAYLYGALSQFLLLESQRGNPAADDGDGWMRQQITQRQAFYRLEHFIDQALEYILPADPADGVLQSAAFPWMTARDAEKERSEGFEFYFDPDEIVIILQASRDVIAALEERLDVLPIARAFAGAKPETALFSGSGSKAVLDPQGTNRLNTVAGITFRATQLWQDPDKDSGRFQDHRFVTASLPGDSRAASSKSFTTRRSSASDPVDRPPRPTRKRKRHK